jgi:hypothetical protein
VVALFDPSAPDVLVEQVVVPVWAVPPEPAAPELDDPVALVVVDEDPSPDGPVVEVPVWVFVPLEAGWPVPEPPVEAVEPLEVFAVAEPEPDGLVLVGDGVGHGVGVGVGVGLVVVLVWVDEVPDDCGVADGLPVDVVDELPVEAPAEEPPVEVEPGEIVEVDEDVLVVAVAPEPLAEPVGVGVCGLPVFEPVVECVFEPVVEEVGDDEGASAEVDVFQFVVKDVVVFPDCLEPEIETGGVTVRVGVGAGVLLAEVLEVL